MKTLYIGLAMCALLGSACESTIGIDYPVYVKEVEEEGGEVTFIDYVTPEFTADASIVSYSQTKSTVNDRPFLPLAIYAVNPADMPRVKEFGFNLVQSYQFFEMSAAEKKNYLDEAQRNNMMAFVSLSGANKLTEDHVSKIKDIVNTYKNHPAVYAWYLADEPSKANVKPEDLKAVYDWIKHTDPIHPVISSNWELGDFKDCCDADMRQLYQGTPARLTAPLENYLNSQVTYKKDWLAIINSYDSGWGEEDRKSMNPTTAFDKLAAAGIKNTDPEWKAEEAYWQPLLDNLANPEDAGFFPSKSFPNTPEEIRSSFYWAFAHGSNGVYYWLYSSSTVLNLRWGWYTIFYQPRLCNALKATMAELKELSKFLVNPSLDSTAFKDETNPGIYIWSKVVDKSRLVMIINETGEEFDGTIDLSPLKIASRTLKVYKEDGRELTLNKNILTESFKKNEVHVYFLK